MKKFVLNEIFLPKPADNKNDAVKKIKAAEFYNTILNAFNFMDFGNDVDDFIDNVKLMTKGQITSADIDAKRFNISNNIHLLDNPLDKYKENVVEILIKGAIRGADKLYRGGKNAINWGRDVKQSWPQIQKATTDRINNDLNIPKKYNDVFHGELFKNFEVTKPTFSQTIDSDGNAIIDFDVRRNKSRFKGYRNPLTNDNRIYTREDIGSFNTSEYEVAEPEILAQWGKIGIPTNSDVELDRLNNSGAVFVHSYTKRDGTKVKSHYRSA